MTRQDLTVGTIFHPKIAGKQKDILNIIVRAPDERETFGVALLIKDGETGSWLIPAGQGGTGGSIIIGKILEERLTPEEVKAASALGARRANMPEHLI